MTLEEAKYILKREGYNLTLNEALTAYDYLTESMLVDKIKAIASKLVKRIKNNDKEATVEAAQLIKKINKTNNIGTSLKKSILITLVGLVGGLSMAHGESLGEFFGNEYNEGSYEKYMGEETIRSNGDPDESELKIDAEHIAVALKGAKISNIEIESAYVDGAESEDRQETVVYNFKDGFSVCIDINDEINIYDNGQLVRQYYPGDGSTQAVLEYAYDMVK